MIHRSDRLWLHWFIPGKVGLVLGDRTTGHRLALIAGRRVLLRWRYTR